MDNYDSIKEISTGTWYFYGTPCLPHNFPLMLQNSKEKCEKNEIYRREGANNFACDSEILINGPLTRTF